MRACSAMSDSLQPHGLQPARLLCAWDSPGKNTGVGYHALLQRRISHPQISRTLISNSSSIEADSLPQSQQGSPNTKVMKDFIFNHQRQFPNTNIP